MRIKAAQLDVVELLLPNAVVPSQLQQVQPRSLVESLDFLVAVVEEDVLLEVEPGVSDLLADAAAPAVLLHNLQLLCSFLPAPFLMLSEEKLLHEAFETELAGVLQLLLNLLWARST